AKQAAARVWRTPAFWETALAVGDAKRWDRPLDKRLVNGAPDAFTNANPCFQINYYLQRTGRTWGVLSNGRRWRLYYRETSSQLDIFYEVDLAQLIEPCPEPGRRKDDRSAERSRRRLAAFRYFYLFFRTVAFHPDAEGRCWLDEVLDQSAAYAVHVGDELKGRVYEALRLLAQGFLDYPQPPLRRLHVAPATERALVDKGTLDTKATAEPSQGFPITSSYHSMFRRPDAHGSQASPAR
ncbi:MAG: hypothetical protein KAW49_05935, partial [Anaerolineae bacterium]|nr:hypothetical protein [Anaerolineae bacterium]